MKLGEFIYEYRKEHSLSMDKFAKITGLSKGYISMLEKGKNPSTGRPIIPSIETIKSISNGTGIDFDSLVSLLDDSQEVSLDKEIKESSPNTICAHIPDDVTLTEEDEKEIQNFINYVVSKRKGNKD